MEKKEIIKKIEKMELPNKIIPHSTKKEIIELENKLNKLNTEKLISEALNLGKSDNKSKEDKNFDYLIDLKNNAILNYVIYTDLKNSDEIKKTFINEIDKFKKSANLIINKKEKQYQESRSEYNTVVEENKLLNQKLLDSNNRFILLQKQFKDKEDEIIKLKEKLRLFRENEKLLNLFHDNFHEKDPLDIVKSYKEKHQGQIDLMQENEELKFTLNKLRQRMKEETEENKKTIKNLKDKIDTLNLEKSELEEGHTGKVSEINYLYKKNKKLEEKNDLLHKMLYQLYNKLFDAFRLDKDIKLNKKYLYLTEEDFNPNIYDDQELFRYIKIMIATTKPAICDQLLRETVANANMILRMFLKNSVNLNLRFDPVTTFRELKLFMEKREDKIKNLENKIKKYKELISNHDFFEKKYENMIKSIEEEKINKINFDKKKESFRKSSKFSSLIVKKNSKLFDNNSNTNSNNLITNITNEIAKTNRTNFYQEENKTLDNKNKLILSSQIIPNKNFELLSTKNNTNENNNNKNINSYFIRPKSFSPNVKMSKKIEYNKERILSANNSEKKSKKIRYYKEPVYQLLLSLQVNNKNTNSYNDVHYKRLRKIKIGKRGDISKENGNQKMLNYMTEIKKFINHTNRLFLYRSKLLPNKNNESFSEKLRKNMKIFSYDKKDFGKTIKRRIIGNINKLINKMEFEETKYIEKNDEKKEEKNKIKNENKT